MKHVLFVLYVADQQRSREFYAKVLNGLPTLDVPGMTEFDIMSGTKLGLMPEKGIRKILSDKTPDPALGSGIPRCELYLIVDQPDEWLERAKEAGAKLVSPMQERDWGHNAAYFSDPDGHIIAFASVL